MDDNNWVSSEKEACSASFSYWEVHWLKLARGLKKVPGGKTAPHNIIFRLILPKFEEHFGRCSMLPVRKTIAQCVTHIKDDLTQTSALQVVNLLGVEGGLVEKTPTSERWLKSTEKPLEVVSGDIHCINMKPIKCSIRLAAGPSWGERLAGGLNSDLIRHIVSSLRSCPAG